MALEPAKLSDFTLASTLGSGTTAKVYDAVHTATGRHVAIKVIDQPGPARSEIRERFAREALLLANVESRHVGNILGFGFDKGQPFLVLERLTGETLDAKLRRDGPVPPAIAVSWIEQLIVGVRDCHDAKVIHRDIKPANIFLHREGGGELVKLIDFGVARLREITGDPAGLTSRHHLIGSMGYMAPEQFENAPGVGFQADLYAVGVVIYRALSGRLPFVSRSLEAIIRMKREQNPPPISSIATGIKNPSLDWFVQKALMREPEMRFQNAREMLESWWDVMEGFEEERQTDIVEFQRPATTEKTGRLRPMGTAPLSAFVEPAPYSDGTGDLPPPLSVTVQLTQTTRLSGDVHEEAPETVQLGRLPADPEAEHTATVAIRDPRGYLEEAPRDAAEDDRLDDLFNLPTRSDPQLKKLVEEELELWKARKRGGG
jgi:serine/threonine protein kinase